ncbi:DMT family transporter [Desulfovibrio ferrophilus]|uniref:EamA domain-containing protein n=1 Tax=Desulfovibrio ferrophilus TaxID=241368 RepID=A0A2Z6AUY4_9BACT|nr:DMT family transporter [Desulfovibrio ferrophilus]BBD07005.1 uncharacterized protein DFE_0279 [Desulfovibrio ferrophilus]
MNPLILGICLALVSTVIWSGNFIVSRGMGQLVHPATLAFMRWVTALVILLPFAARALWRERQIIRKHFKYLMATSLIGITVFNTVIYMAGRTTEALNMALISTSSPVFIILFARMFLGDPITRNKLWGVVAAIGGVVLIITRGNLSLLFEMNYAEGDLWMLLAAALFAAYSIMVRIKPKDIGATAFLAASFGMGLVMLTPWAAWEILRYGLPELTSPIMGSVLYIGLGASLVAYMCWNGAVSRIGPAQAGMVYYSLPLFSGLEAWLLLGEPVGWFHFVGGASIIGGIFLASRMPQFQPKK